LPQVETKLPGYAGKRLDLQAKKPSHFSKTLALV